MSLAKLIEIRRALEAGWSEHWAREAKRGVAQPECVSGRLCRITSFALAPLLGELYGGRWRVAGGEAWPEQGLHSGGFLDSAGQWRGHYWLTCGDQLVDFTADQFGAEVIVVATTTDSRYCANYTPQELHEHGLNCRVSASLLRKSLRLRLPLRAINIDAPAM